MADTRNNMSVRSSENHNPRAWPLGPAKSESSGDNITCVSREEMSTLIESKEYANIYCGPTWASVRPNTTTVNPAIATQNNTLGVLGSLQGDRGSLQEDKKSSRETGEHP